MGKVTVVGLGPAGPDLTTEQTRSVIENTPRLYLRTTQHPAASVLRDAVSFDHIYEQAATFVEVYLKIRDYLLYAAAEGDLVYAVPGSPLVLERSVELLRDAAADGEVELNILPAMSFLDTAWSALGIDPVETGVHLIDGHRFATASSGRAGPLLVAGCHARHVLGDIKLTLDDPPESATVLQHLGLPSQSVYEVAWADLDRCVEADHLTSIYITEPGPGPAAEFTRFEELVRTLRAECPWDREQTHGSLRRHLLEEAHETLEALDARAVLNDNEPDSDLDEHLCEELGDLLYQIFFHSRLAAERGAFTVADVAQGIHDKLVSRHPHVFGDVEAQDTKTVLGNWERIKADEKGRSSSMDGISGVQPALVFAMKAQDRAVTVGFDRVQSCDAGMTDFAEWIAESRTEPSERDLGDLLFAAVRLARHLDHDPETSLRGAVRRFIALVRTVEGLASQHGDDFETVSKTTLSQWWRNAASSAASAS